MIPFISALDANAVAYLYDLRSMPVVDFFIAVSELGRWEIVFKIAAVACLCLLLLKRYADILGLMTAVAGSTITVLALKYFINRPRPDFIYQAYIESSNLAFPSAHAALSMALYGYFMYLLLQSGSNRIKRAIIGFLPVVILFVGFSRLYLGVHYPSDVLAGFAVGFAFIYLGIQIRLRLLNYSS
jgi:membrane-associated phospholipid phosphatase